MHNPFTYILLISIILNQPIIPLVSAQQDTPDSLPHQTYLPIVSEQKCSSCYYIDSNNGSDSNSGTEPDRAWKSLRKLNSLQINPGTTILLKYDSVWTERLRLFSSGTPDNPITITTYGYGTAPILSNPGDPNPEGTVITIFGSYYIIENIHIQDSGFGIDIFSDHNVIQNAEINNVGIGVVLMGSNNLITHNYIHDTRAVHSDPGDDDDWGADGVDIQAPHNEISFNRFINCEAPSGDYGMTGGPIEIYKNGDYTSFHNNWSFNSESFVEISGGAPASAQNIDISYNVIINATRFTIIHAIQIQNFRVENNTLIDLRVHEDQIGRYIVFMGTPSPDTSYIFRNNIIYISNYWMVFWDEVIHENNLYFLPYGTQLGIPLGPNELINIDPQFVNINTLDFRLLPSSPAINAGINLGFTQDFELNPVPVGNLPDIGAYEYQGN
jgi:hypothetical protein